VQLNPDPAAPLSPAEFAACMAPLGPFEAAPRLAVGVSGGADSLALTLLLHHWAGGRGGGILALTVDHGLRPESGAEAARLGLWLAARGIPHAVLPWTGPKPASGIQAAARTARHGLLVDYCRGAGILHLALAHHRGDQAETQWLRAGMGSGPDGLAGMAAVRELADLRLLRPLLPLARSRLEATCTAHGQPWLDDPSNRADRFARVRARRALAEAGPATLDGLAETARRLGLARSAADAQLADILAEHACFFPEGWLTLDPRAITRPPFDTACRLLARLVAAVGGAAYPPRRERLERLVVALRAGKPGGASLGGCLLRPARGGDLLLCREPAAVSGPISLDSGGTAVWDGRFRFRWRGAGTLTVAALDRMAEAAARTLSPRSARLVGLPAAVRRTLPALWRGDRLTAVPHLDVGPGGHDEVGWTMRPEPSTTAAGLFFSVVRDGREII